MSRSDNNEAGRSREPRMGQTCITPSDWARLKKRSDDLESRMMFQEDQSEGLQRALYEQSIQVESLTKRLEQAVHSLRLAGGQEGSGDQEKPPHY